jgi:hypothetical protein
VTGGAINNGAPVSAVSSVRSCHHGLTIVVSTLTGVLDDKLA